MKKTYKGLILTIAILMVMPLQSLAATPRETAESGVNKVLATLTDPAFKSKSEDEKIAKLTEVISPIFDFQELSRRTLGREWKKMNTGQQKEFVELFRKLLQGVYAERLLAYSEQKVIFDKETMLIKGRAEVQSYLQTSDGKKIPLFLPARRKGWQLEGLRCHHRRGQYGQKLPYPVQTDPCQGFAREVAGNFTR